MKRKILHAFLLLGCINPIFGQDLDTNWTRQYDRTSAFSDVHIASFDSDKFLVHYGKSYFEINGNGDSLKGGSFDPALGNNGPVISAINHHEIYVGGYASSGSYIAKLDSNYNTIWNTSVVASGFGEGVRAIFFDSSYVYVGGSHSSDKPFIAKLDTSGNLIWYKDFQQSSFSCFRNIMKLRDGNYLASGNMDDYPLAIKFDANGDTAWSYSESIFISFYTAPAVQRPDNDTILLVMRNKLIGLDPHTGTRVDSVHCMNDYYDFFVNGDTLYLAGMRRTQSTSGDNYPLIETKNWNYDSTNAWQRDWDMVPTVSNQFYSLVHLKDNSFIAAGRIRDSINTSANTWNIYIAKFNDTAAATQPNGINEHRHYIAQNIIYPNPAQGYFSLSDAGIKSVFIIDVLGKKSTITSVHNKFDISSLPQGVYFILNKENRTFLGKLIKE